jgi:hypothetical protein
MLPRTADRSNVLAIGAVGPFVAVSGRDQVGVQRGFNGSAQMATGGTQ